MRSPARRRLQCARSSGAGTTAAKFAGDVAAALKKPDYVDELKAPADLLTKLWSKDRPAIVVVLGHYQTRPVTGEINAPRIKIPGGWLIARKIEQEVEQHDAW